MRLDTFLLSALFLCTGCNAMNGEIYTLDQIAMSETREENGRTLLLYQPLMETLYFSPGVRIRTSGDDILLTAVRCHIKKQCEVDAKATTDAAVNQISLPTPKGSIYWEDGNTKRLINRQSSAD